MNWLKRKWSLFYERFISLKGSPESVARSFAIGFWIAWWPIIGTHSVFSIAGGFLFRANLPAIYLASWVCNPLTIPLLLLADFELGKWLIGGPDLGDLQFSDLTFQQMMAMGWGVLVPMMLGGVILGTANALLGYFPIKHAVIRVRRRRQAIAARDEATS